MRGWRLSRAYGLFDVLVLFIGIQQHYTQSPGSFNMFPHSMMASPEPHKNVMMPPNSPELPNPEFECPQRLR